MLLHPLTSTLRTARPKVVTGENRKYDLGSNYIQRENHLVHICFSYVIFSFHLIKVLQSMLRRILKTKINKQCSFHQCYNFYLLPSSVLRPINLWFLQKRHVKAWLQLSFFSEIIRAFFGPDRSLRRST